MHVLIIGPRPVRYKPDYPHFKCEESIYVGNRMDGSCMTKEDESPSNYT